MLPFSGGAGEPPSSAPCKLEISSGQQRVIALRVYKPYTVAEFGGKMAGGGS